MKLLHAFLCDFAEESGGKIHALGVGVNRILAPQAPATHPLLTFVANVKYTHAEAGEKALRLEVVNADGRVMQTPLTIAVQFGAPDGTTGLARLVISLRDLKFDSYGDYAIQATIDGHSIAAMPLKLEPLTVRS